MIAIIDYDAGNLNSVVNAFSYIGEEAVTTRDRDLILSADRVVLPGVGAFGDAMLKLEQYNLTDVVKEAAFSGKPFLGICLGMQLLFESSDEAPGVKGLSLLPGKIIHIPAKPGLKIPQIGWNSLNVKPGAKLFKGIPDDPFVYFVHSYYLNAANKSDVAATTEYGTILDVSVEHGSLFGCQFHPEKSADVGLSILKNFAEL